MHKVERYHDISCGHRVYGHESKCAHLHGHNYRVHFEVTAMRTSTDLDEIGRVLDFSVVKSELCMWLEENWDHKFLVWDQDPWAEQLKSMDPVGVVLMPFNPTAENLAEFLVRIVGPTQLVKYGVELVSCRIEETRKCSATYLKD